MVKDADKSLLSKLRIYYIDMALKKPKKSYDQAHIAIMLIALFILVLISLNALSGGVRPLSEFQITACVVASERGTCHSRLTEVGIVLPEECCGALARCCG
jgi:hypothetical protein